MKLIMIGSWRTPNRILKYLIGRLLMRSQTITLCSKQFMIMIETPEATMIQFKETLKRNIWGNQILLDL